MQTIAVLALCVVSTQAFLFGPGGLFGAPAGGCDPCAAARSAPYYPPQPAYQAPAYQAPAYQAPAYQQAPAYSAPQHTYSQPAPAYQTAPAYNHEQAPAPVQYQSNVVEQAPQAASAGAYAQPPPPPPASYATGPAASAGYKRF